jgi:carbon-monoxide dehydrogenase medium subunit
LKPSPFTYHRPRSIDEALDVLADHGEAGKVLAGGQSLVPLMSMRLAAPANLIDINHIAELDSVEVTDTHVRVGAIARHSRVEADPAAYDAIPLLRQGLVNVAHPTIRNRGTTVGSLVHADPAAEMPAVLALLDGVVELRTSSGTREVPAGDFFEAPMQSAIRPGELAVAARFTRPPEHSGSAFLELARRQGDYAMCGVGALVTTDADDAITSARVALVSVGDGPVLVDVTGCASGSGNRFDGGFDVSALRELVDGRIDPEPDIHATAEYRRHLARVLTLRALRAAQDRARRAVGRHRVA